MYAFERRRFRKLKQALGPSDSIDERWIPRIAGFVGRGGAVATRRAIRAREAAFSGGSVK
jgi:hypothetical protein